jgi:membrane protease YdiL (CAAX protease family)
MQLTRDPDSTQDQRECPFHPLLFYSLAITCAWLAWAPLLLHKLQRIELPVPFPVALFICQTIGAFSPLLSLWLIQRLKHDPDLVKRVFRKVRFTDVAVYWFLLPALLPVAIAVATALLHGVLSPAGEITILRPAPLDELGWTLLLVIPFSFVMALIGSPLGEEPGWRGYIFDRFARTGRGMEGSVLVAVMWWIWHIPLFLILDVTPNAYSFLEMAGHSLLIDTLFLLSGGNLLVAMLYHQGVSTGFMFFASKTQTVYGLTLLLGIAVMARIFAERYFTRAL